MWNHVKVELPPVMTLMKSSHADDEAPNGLVQYLHRPMCSSRKVCRGFERAQYGAPIPIK